MILVSVYVSGPAEKARIAYYDISQCGRDGPA